MRVAVDIGQTGLRIQLPRTELIELDYGSRHLSIPGAAETAGQTIASGIRNAGIRFEAQEALEVSVGTTGFTPAGARKMAASLIHELGARTVTVASDIVTAHLAAHPKSYDGITVIAGTGLAVCAHSPGAGFRVLASTGWLLGDLGGGYAIGAQGLRSALRFEDRAGGSRLLYDLACSTFGSARGGLEEIYTHASPVQTVANFAPYVADAARRGDEEATKIWHDTVNEVARYVDSALTDFEATNSTISLVLTGGLSQENELFVAPLRERYRAAALVEVQNSGSLLGAELLFEPLGDAFANQVIRSENPNL